jgi:hypothetical protein
MEEREDSEDDGNGACPAFVIHQSPADQDSASGDDEERCAERKKQGRHEGVMEHGFVRPDVWPVADEHEYAGRNHPECADDDPQSAEDAKVALEAATSGRN